MSPVDEGPEKVYVVTYKELLFITIVFLVILVVLYPKDLLKQQIQAETSSYDLSMLYLENLLEHSPDDESLMLILAEQSLRSGKKELAFNLLNVLLESKNKKIKTKATLLEYELKKDNYFYLKDSEEMAQEKRVIDKLFGRIYKEKMFDEANYNKWYQEAVFASHNEAMYYFIRKKLKDTPEDMKLTEQAYYLANSLKQYENALQYIRILVQKDTTGRDKWLDAYYYTLVDNKQYQQAESLLIENAKESLRWKNRLAEFYMMRKLYIKSFLIYEDMFNTIDEYKFKKEYYFKAINVLQAGGYLEKCASFAHKYEEYYINDVEVRKHLLKLYVATGNLDMAVALSKKILKRMMR